MPDTAGGKRALAGRRVLELADQKGVYCGKLLADMGADVIKIERPGGDATRDIPPFWGNQPHPERGLFFLYTNTSKRGVTLDIARVDGQALLGGWRKPRTWCWRPFRRAFSRASVSATEISAS